MRFRTTLTFLVSIALLVVSRAALAAQDNTPTGCSVNYEDNNLPTFPPLKMHEIRGTTAIKVGEKSQPGGVPGACLGLFTEKDHRLVATTKVGPDGRFELANVPPGRYRLIARANGLCTANIPLEVIKSRRRNAELVVYFRPTGMDVCSTGELFSAPAKRHP